MENIKNDTGLVIADGENIAINVAGVSANCYVLAEKIRSANIKFDLIVGVGHDGLILATVIADKLLLWDNEDSFICCDKRIVDGEYHYPRVLSGQKVLIVSCQVDDYTLDHVANINKHGGTVVGLCCLSNNKGFKEESIGLHQGQLICL